MKAQKFVILTKNSKVQRPNILSWTSALITSVADAICDGKKLKRIGLYLLVLIIVLWTVLPLVWMFLSSIFPYKELISDRLDHWLPSKATFNHYHSFFNPEKDISSRFLSSLSNSLIIATVTTVVCLFFG